MRGLSPRELHRVMQTVKRAGLSIKQLDGVESVTIKLKDKELIVRDPQVTTMKMGDQIIFQVVGEVEERPLIEDIIISDEDVQLVASQAGVGLEEARKALKATKGDLARAILHLKST
ncbi:MAG: nascent polypeptide-associated complex protein [Candidatus Nezhaarchaeota archaeon]|nr:nascent polypeptide-associated complex protein [Candidatus Nezhaarchaeota archaeon]MCX8141996.1 nascent polypeptide-associated complex protein [Candidatus Nezhaarchaeota archaeon]MDW8050223.1 nascent polypeptide-associated complex protein [Nitrososphaerota archaeon]